MKINIEDRLRQAVESGKSFGEQHTEALASGRRFVIVNDMKLGRHVIFHTDEELAHFAEVAVRQKENAAALPPDPLAVWQLAVKNKLGLTDADLAAAEVELQRQQQSQQP